MKKHVQILSLIIVVGIPAVFGCSKQEPSGAAHASGTPSDVADPAASLTPRQRALKAKQELFKQLSSELMSAMASGGPVEAIEVCSQKAPQIAAKIGKEHGVSIGRTSFKLRNTANAPPEWAVEFVAQRVTDPQFVELEGQRTGALLPIRLKAQCLVCHGPKEQIAEDVRDRLAALYPNDTATGFQDGDLRGWFWVEVNHDQPKTLDQ